MPRLLPSTPLLTALTALGLSACAGPWTVAARASLPGSDPPQPASEGARASRAPQAAGRRPLDLSRSGASSGATTEEACFGFGFPLVATRVAPSQSSSNAISPAFLEQEEVGAQAADAAPEPTAVASEAGPYRLGQTLELPDWFELDVLQQTRYEALDEDFRPLLAGSNQLWLLRHMVAATVHYEDWRLKGEFIDARAFDVPSGKFIANTIVDTVDLLQAYVGREFDGVFDEGDSLDVRVGRQTLDLGGRRLVARNLFRQTVNAFTGAAATYNAGPRTVDLFAFMPVARLPLLPQDLRDNEIEFDEELENTLFTGAHLIQSIFEGAAQGELYAYGIFEDDQDDFATRNRQLITLGGRLSRKPPESDFGYDSETAIQFGQSRSSANPNNTTDLDHFAWWQHLTLNYRFAGSLKPTLGFLFDWATGDEDPNDGTNERFDSLFGARVAEFGPTSIYGPFGRSNIVSPGVRFEFDPVERVRARLTHRLYWLDSDTDRLASTGLSDPTGNSGSFAGHALDFRVRYDLYPKNLRLEAGISHLFADEFILNAPLTVDPGDTTYFYFQTNLRL